MRKLIILMLVLGMASLANATVIDVVFDGVGSWGHAGTSSDPLHVGETIGIKIVLNYNPYPGSPTYAGYLLSSMDLDLHVSGPGSLSLTNGDIIKLPPSHAPFYPWYNSTVTATGVDHLAGSAMPPFGPGPGDLVWDFVITFFGLEGLVYVDLTRAGVTEYSELGYPINWIDLSESDLGDLVIHGGIPEPTTLLLLGLGSLALLRKRRT